MSDGCSLHPTGPNKHYLNWLRLWLIRNFIYLFFKSNLPLKSCLSNDGASQIFNCLVNLLLKESKPSWMKIPSEFRYRNPNWIGCWTYNSLRAYEREAFGEKSNRSADECIKSKKIPSPKKDAFIFFTVVAYLTLISRKRMLMAFNQL